MRKQRRMQKKLSTGVTAVREQSPQRDEGESPCWRVWGEVPRKLNTLVYLTVNCACNFVHKRSGYPEKSVGLLRLQMPVGDAASHPLPLSAPVHKSLLCQ